jgi:thiaminase/transcriptional activator TenA
LSKEGSRDDIYQKWIDAYASEGYGKVVQEILDIVDVVAAEATQEQLAQMRKLYRRGCRYEWMFWDSAYHLRKWPPGKANN